MADETVDIGNVGKGGVASEATLESLVKAVEFLAKKEGFDPKKSAEKAKKLAESFDDTIEVSKKNREALEGHTEAVDESAESISMLGKVSGGLFSALGAVTASFFNMGAELIDGKTQLKDFAKHVPIVGGTLSDLTGFLDDSMTAFRRLSNVGGAFNNDLIELRASAFNTYMSLDTFVDFVENNAESLSRFGGTVTGGVKRLEDLNRGLGDQRQSLMDMGFTFEEINEQLVNYQMLTRAGSRAERRSAAEEAKAAAAYAKNLSTLSKLTGEEIDSINAKVAANQTDVAFQMKMAKMSKEEQDKVQAAMAEATSMYGPAAAEFFKQQLLGMPPLTEETQIFAATLPGLAEQVKRLSRTAQDSSVSLDQFNEGSTDRMVAAMKSAAESGEKYESLLAATAGGLDGPGKVIATALESMGKQFTDYTDDNGKFQEKRFREDIETAKREQGNRNAITGALNDFEIMIRNIRKNIFDALIQSGVFEMLEDGLDRFSEWLESDQGVSMFEDLGAYASKLANKFVAFIESFEGMSFEEIKDKLLEDIGSIFADLGDSIVGAIGSGILSALTSPYFLGGLLAVFGAKFAASKLFDMFPGSGTSKTTDVDSSKQTTQRTPKKALKPSQTMGGKIGGNIGGALGGLAGGVLEGITNALAGAGAKAPLIALGAAAVGGAITLIGAGIAGATWLVGNALPSFAEGMKSFEDLDGARLKSAADGMIAMTGAMAAFGAGSVVSGIGNMVGSVAEGIAGFFGGDSPLDKLKQFADADIDGDAIKQNASSINSFSEAISNLDVLPKKGLLSTVGDALFGNDPEAEKAEFETQTSEIKEKLDKANDWLLTAQSSLSIAQNRLRVMENDFAQPGSTVTNDMLSTANAKLDSALENLQERQQRVKELEAQLVGIDKQVVNASLSQKPANSTDFANLNELDSDNVNNYREAMENLVTTLENLNGVLSENQGLDLPEGATAATATTGGGEGGNRLNRTMDALLATTTQTSDYLKKIERNTKSIGGDISKGRISDSRG